MVFFCQLGQRYVKKQKTSPFQFTVPNNYMCRELFWLGNSSLYSSFLIFVATQVMDLWETNVVDCCGQISTNLQNLHLPGLPINITPVIGPALAAPCRLEQGKGISAHISLTTVTSPPSPPLKKWPGNFGGINTNLV